MVNSCTAAGCGMAAIIFLASTGWKLVSSGRPAMTSANIGGAALPCMARTYASQPQAH